MENFLSSYNPVMQALFATLFTWFATSAGASCVFFTRRSNQKLMDGMLGFAAGIMIAASYWSLLAPAIEMTNHTWQTATIGFLIGAAFLFVVHKLLPHLHKSFSSERPEGISTTWQRSVLLVLAITLHNIPEGLAVGVAFGAANSGTVDAPLGGALAIALGIAIQDFPEGLAVSMPLRREGMSSFTAFMYGQASGFVEVIGGVVGALVVMSIQSLLPYALSFAAGAMIFVTIEELIPESYSNGYVDVATSGAILGFALMMALDVGLS